MPISNQRSKDGKMGSGKVINKSGCVDDERLVILVRITNTSIHVDQEDPR